MLEGLKKQVKEANIKLVELGLVKLTFGNLSAVNESGEYVAIKPSGVNYQLLESKDISILNLQGDHLEGKKPSSDTPSHLELYKNFEGIKSIIHTHSRYATTFAQAGIPLDCLGTTHADYFHGTIPLVVLDEEDVKIDYEKNTGKKVVEFFKQNKINHLEISACLVQYHGPFVWGETIEKALENTYVLEEIAKMNLWALTINPKLSLTPQHLLDKHYFRKHGKNAYYGQRE